MTTRTFVQAVPWEPTRAENAVRLAGQTSATVVWDEHCSAYSTFLAVMAGMGDQPGILLEDDVVLTVGWREKVEAAVAQHPDSVINFFNTDRDDAALGTRWMDGKVYAANLCVYFPAGVAADFLRYVGEARTSYHEDYHDLLFGRYLRRRNRPYLQHVPSLVQHLPGPSVVRPDRRQDRHSLTFEGAR